MCPQFRLDLCFRDPYVIMSLLYQRAVFLVLIYTPNFLSFCHHQGFLTCADFPVVGLTHPVVALTERTVVLARLCHLADADSTLTPAPAIAQLPPWDAAPELWLSPGQPAGSRNTQTAPVGDSKQNKLGSRPCSSELMRAWLIWNHPPVIGFSRYPEYWFYHLFSYGSKLLLAQITQFSLFSSETSLLLTRLLVLYFTYLFNYIGLIHFPIRHIWYICIDTYGLIIHHETFRS